MAYKLSINYFGETKYALRIVVKYCVENKNKDHQFNELCRDLSRYLESDNNEELKITERQLNMLIEATDEVIENIKSKQEEEPDSGRRGDASHHYRTKQKLSLHDLGQKLSNIKRRG